MKACLSSHLEYAEWFEPLPFNSGYFMCLQLKNNLDCEKVRQILLNEFNTGLINLAGVLRIAFSAVSASVIPKIFENIYGPKYVLVVRLRQTLLPDFQVLEAS